MVAVKAWMEGETFANVAPRLLLVIVGMVAFLGVILEVTTRMGQRAKRVLQFDEKHVTFSHNTKLWRIPWAQVMAFQVEPIPSQADFKKIHCVGLAARRAKTPRKWSLVLDRTVQLPALISELRVRHQVRPSFAVEEFSEALPAAGPRRSPRIWPVVLGYMFLVHGLPLLAVGLGGERSGQPSEPRRELSESAQRFIIKHFASPHELRRCFLITGGVLTGLGLGLGCWGIRMASVCQKENEAAMECDRAAEAWRPKIRILEAANNAR